MKMHFKDGKGNPQRFKEKLRLETKSARSYNMEDEEIIGMFHAAKP